MRQALAPDWKKFYRTNVLMFWTYKEVASLLRCSEPSVRDYIKRSGVPIRAIRWRSNQITRVLLWEDLQKVLHVRVGTLGDGSAISKAIERRIAGNALGGQRGMAKRWGNRPPGYLTKREIKRREKLAKEQSLIHT